MYFKPNLLSIKKNLMSFIKKDINEELEEARENVTNEKDKLEDIEANINKTEKILNSLEQSRKTQISTLEKANDSVIEEENKFLEKYEETLEKNRDKLFYEKK